MKTETSIKPNKISKGIQMNLLVSILLLVLVGLSLGIGYYLNDKVSGKRANTITVVGTAIVEEGNKLASFTADITKQNEDKQQAVAELNETSTQVKDAIKGFGIEEKDIKTNFYNVYQNSEWDPITQESKMTDWSATISIEVKLRDIDRAGELGTLLATLDTTYLSGPNFSTEPGKDNNDLLGKAVENARTKAEEVALVSNRKLGKILSVDETNSIQNPDVPMYRESAVMLEESVSFDPGTTNVSKSVTVTFELK